MLLAARQRRAEGYTQSGSAAIAVQMASWQLMHTLMGNAKTGGQDISSNMQKVGKYGTQMVWSRGKQTYKLQDANAKES